LQELIFLSGIAENGNKKNILFTATAGFFFELLRKFFAARDIPLSLLLGSFFTSVQPTISFYCLLACCLINRIYFVPLRVVF